MKKTFIAVVAALALPASAIAQDATPSANKAAKQACSAIKAQLGSKTFKQTYGHNNAYGKCVSAAVRAEKENISEAKAECAAVREDPNAAKNAYGKCVSSKAKAASKEDVKTQVNAAKTCKGYRTANGADWAPYAGKKNGFGKCVSDVARAKNDEATQS